MEKKLDYNGFFMISYAGGIEAPDYVHLNSFKLMNNG
jgi:hypothetical protein